MFFFKCVLIVINKILALKNTEPIRDYAKLNLSCITFFLVTKMCPRSLWIRLIPWYLFLVFPQERWCGFLPWRLCGTLGGFVAFCWLFGLPKSNIAMENVSQPHVVHICIFDWHESHKGENSVKIEYFDLHISNVFIFVSSPSHWFPKALSSRFNEVALFDVSQGVDWKDS